MTDLTILGFDTSGPWCTAALLQGGDCTATAHAEMKKGQAEHLMPLLTTLLSDNDLTLGDLDGIGVGTGPGNFTGIRISVSAARGLALGLGIPAVGVTLFDALACGQTGPLYLTLRAPRDQVYVQIRNDERVGDVSLQGFDDLPPLPPGAVVIGEASQDIAARLGAPFRPAAFAAASAIARVAEKAIASGADIPRPRPFYVRPADAAPSRDLPPRILS